MPIQRVINRVKWDGHGEVNIEESTFSRTSEKEIIDRAGAYPSTEKKWVSMMMDDDLIIHHKLLYAMSEELKRAHRLLNENSQSNNQLVVAKRNAEDDIDRYRTQSFALQASNSNLQTQISGLQTQLTDKERQIQWGIGQLAQVQNQLALEKRESGQKQVQIEELTDRLNNLRIKSNDLKKELEGSRNVELLYRERKLDELVRNSGLNRERVDNLRDAYGKLKRAKNPYNQDDINAAQNEIDTIKREFFQTDVSVENLHKIYKVCKQIGELLIKSAEQSSQPQFEAHTQAPPPRNY